MIFYHGTSLENWNKIQKEGVLFGRIPNPNKEYNPSRCTYLATDFNEAKYYGDIVLEVEYNPLLHPEMNNIIKNNSVLGFALRRRNAPANSANNLLICGMISYYFVKI